MSAVNHAPSSLERNEEIGLKELFILIGSYLTFFRKKWYVILIALIFFNTLLILKYKFIDKEKFSATMMVLLNDNSNTSSLGSILGGFGLSAQDDSALDKVITIAQSQDVFGKVLLSGTKLPAANGLLINYIIDSMGFRKGFRESEAPIFNTFKHFKSRSLDSCTDQEWLVLNKVKDNLLTKMLSFKATKEGILEISCTGNAAIPIPELMTNLYNQLDMYYMANQVGSEVKTFTSLQNRRDSIDGALSGAHYRVAKYRDGNQGNIFATENAPIAKMEQEIMFLGAMKVEAIKNYEIAKISMNSKQPYLKVINMPRYPLSSKSPSLLKNILIGTLLALFLSIGGLSLYKFIKDVAE